MQGVPGRSHVVSRSRRYPDTAPALRQGAERAAAATQPVSPPVPNPSTDAARRPRPGRAAVRESSDRGAIAATRLVRASSFLLRYVRAAASATCASAIRPAASWRCARRRAAAACRSLPRASSSAAATRAAASSTRGSSAALGSRSSSWSVVCAPGIKPAAIWASIACKWYSMLPGRARTSSPQAAADLLHSERAPSRHRLHPQPLLPGKIC